MHQYTFQIPQDHSLKKRTLSPDQSASGINSPLVLARVPRLKFSSTFDHIEICHNKAIKNNLEVDTESEWKILSFKAFNKLWAAVQVDDFYIHLQDHNMEDRVVKSATTGSEKCKISFWLTSQSNSEVKIY